MKINLLNLSGTLLIVFATVSFQAIKVAITNPVKVSEQNDLILYQSRTRRITLQVYNNVTTQSRNCGITLRPTDIEDH